MAGDISYQSTDPNKSAMDYPEHEKTYALFLGIAKWMSITVAGILVLMAIFLTGSGH
jgi:hypothetical protein